MAGFLARVSVKGILPVPNEAAVWLVRYGAEGRFGLPGGQMTAEDNGKFDVTLRREVKEELDAEIVLGSLAIVDVWMNLRDPKVGGDNRMIVVCAADLLSEPSGKISSQRENGVKMPLSLLGTIDLAPEYEQVIQTYIQGQDW